MFSNLSGWPPRVESGCAAQFLPKRAFFLADLLRHLHIGDNIEIAAFAALAFRQTLPAHTQLLAIVGAGRNAHFYPAAERGDCHGGAEHSFPRREVQIVIEICVARAEIRMRGQSNSQVKVAGRPPPPAPWPPLPRRGRLD